MHLIKGLLLIFSHLLSFADITIWGVLMVKTTLKEGRKESEVGWEGGSEMD